MILTRFRDGISIRKSSLAHTRLLLIATVCISVCGVGAGRSLQGPSNQQTAKIDQEKAKPATKTDDQKPTDPDVPEAARLDSRLVELSVKVADVSGRGVADLKKENFSIFEDGVKQSITFFEPVSAPITLVLMLDFSSSTKDKDELIKEAAYHFVDTIKPNDRLAVVAFTEKFKLVSDFTNDHAHLKKQIGKIKGGRGTALYDALWRVSEMLAADKKSGRKAIVLMTDGVDESIEEPDMFPANHPYEQLLSRVTEQNASIYPIYLDTEEEEVKLGGFLTHKTYQIARFRLSQLAEQTGGLGFRANELEDLANVYQQVADELRTIYSVGYNPSNPAADGKWRKIKVEVDREHTIARTRRGYFAK